VSARGLPVWVTIVAGVIVALVFLLALWAIHNEGSVNPDSLVAGILL
jgi:uncharacterized integral membrane protein